MSSFRIQGGQKLQGEIIPQGAKNEALQVICATLLTAKPVTISNVPDITDVNILIEIVRGLGCEVKQTNTDTYCFTSPTINVDFLKTEKYKAQASRLRGSIMLLGPLLARCGAVNIPRPGGDRIGRRKLDTHFTGLQCLGAHLRYDQKDLSYYLKGAPLKGCDITLEEASVTGTANVIMAAVLAQGTTTIYNAACEPYVQQLCHMLNQMGAKITGVKSNLLTIQGVSTLAGTTHQLLPDMIEIGSFIGMAAITKSAITIKDCHINKLGPIPEAFKKMGIQLVYKGDDIYIPAQEHYTVASFMDRAIPIISDAPWPGLTPDLLSVMLVVATQADGAVLIHQKMFESRLFFVDKLIDMGAHIILCDPHRASVIGLNQRHPLRGIKMSSPDIRAGIALLIAALSAQGESIISNIEQIERGYQHIEQRLKGLGASISRID